MRIQVTSNRAHANGTIIYIKALIAVYSVE
jgi:hypothetical protein